MFSWRFPPPYGRVYSSTSILLLATEGEALCVERDNSERALRNELPSHLKELPSEGKEGEISGDLAGGF